MKTHKILILLLILSILVLLIPAGCTDQGANAVTLTNASPQTTFTSATTTPGLNTPSDSEPVSITPNLTTVAGTPATEPIVQTSGTSKTYTSSSIEIVPSFPNGPPALNQTAELRCKIASHVPFIYYELNVRIELPEALELVSGKLSWSGDLQAGQQINEISAMVKSVKTGNWTVNTFCSLNPQLNEGTSFGSQPLHIYVSIKENSAEWRIGSSYDSPPAPTGGFVHVPSGIPPTTNPAPASPVKVELKAAKLPLLSEPVELTCTVVSEMDIPDTLVRIKQLKGIEFTGGKPEWRGDLKANEVVSFSVTIVFQETGKYSLEASAKHVIDEKNSIGGLGMLYINMMADHSEYGWKPAPIKITQINPENEKYLVKTGNETEEEFTPGKHLDLPAPLPITPDGQPVNNTSNTACEKSPSESKDANITVTGYWYYYTDLQSPDYRDGPAAPAVPAKYFLVYLYDQNGNYKGYDYTDENGYFSISNVDPSNGLKSRLWCYVNYLGDELRVIYFGSTTTGLDDVWYSQNTYTYYFPADGGTHTMGSIYHDCGADGDGALWIKDDMDRAYRYPNSPITQGSCTARWTENNPEDTCAGGGMIKLSGPVQKAPDVVIHEYAHVSMAHINPVTYTPANPHYMWTAYDVYNGWVEGWADFFPLVVNGNPTYTNENNNNEDMETHSIYGATGDTVEGRVACALWDLFDNNNEGYDLFTTSFSDIWTTFCNTQPGYTQTFHQFWDKTSFKNNLNAFQTLYQNTIDYGKHLAVDIVPASTGVVYKIPESITYPENYEVILSAQPFSGYLFSYWNGYVADTLSHFSIITGIVTGGKIPVSR